MKIALCLHGLSYGNNDKRARPILFDIGYKYIKTELLDKYDVDVFVHTWDTGNKEKILKYYNPKKSCFVGKRKIKNRQMSSLFSYRESNNLRKEYEKENNIKYDTVILTRFDIALKINKKLEQFDMSRFYFPDAMTFHPKGTKDVINTDFFKSFRYMIELLLMSNGENIDKFCNFYDHYCDMQKLVKKPYMIVNSKKHYVSNPAHHVFMEYLLNPISGLSDVCELMNIDHLYVHKPKINPGILQIPIPDINIPIT